MESSSSLRKKPTLSVKIASIFFAVAGILLFLGLIKSAMDIPSSQKDFHIFLVYIFLASISFFVSFGLYRHKQWSLYVAYALLLYMVINFLLNVGSSVTIDLIVAGIPIAAIVVIIIFMLIRKHNHFIH